MNIQIDIIAILLTVGGLIFSIGTWFVTNTLGRIKELETNKEEINKKVALVELDNNKNHEHLVEKISELFESFKELVIDFKQLNQKIK